MRVDASLTPTDHLLASLKALEVYYLSHYQSDDWSTHAEIAMAKDVIKAAFICLGNPNVDPLDIDRAKTLIDMIEGREGADDTALLSIVSELRFAIDNGFTAAHDLKFVRQRY